MLLYTYIVCFCLQFYDLAISLHTTGLGELGALGRGLVGRDRLFLWGEGLRRPMCWLRRLISLMCISLMCNKNSITVIIHQDWTKMMEEYSEGATIYESVPNIITLDLYASSLVAALIILRGMVYHNVHSVL